MSRKYRLDLLDSLEDNIMEYRSGKIFLDEELCIKFAKYSGLRSKKKRHLYKRGKKEIIKAIRLGLEELAKENRYREDT